MAEAKKKTIKKSSPRTAKAAGKKACTVAGCKRAYRAKGYCFFHYKKWRQGDLPHSRYRTCGKPECRKKVLKGGLCETHYNEKFKKADAAAAA
ncbi:MAG: vegetative protein [Myxococcota bacterium]|nr:vegetative protein [Myxococcota bacterium]